MKKLVLAFGVALTFAVTLFSARDASAFCGFYVSGADTKLFNNATQVVLMRDGLRTAFSMQNNYEGPPENFAMVVPVPVVLQQDNVKTLPREIFDRVDALDAPRLVEYWEQDPCDAGEELKKGGPLSHSRRMFAPSAAAAGKDLGVTVEAEFVVGEYQIVILSAKDGLGLETWLTNQNYKIPEGSGPFFKPYIDQGSKFFVAKVDVSKVKMENGMAMLSPLRFHFDSDRFSLPVRLGLMNAKNTQDLVVHILAKKQRYEVSNYNNVFIPTNIDVSDETRENFGSFYAALLDRTLEKNPKSVVTEYSWDAATCDPCPVPGLTPSELLTLGDDVMPNAEDAGAIAPPSRRGGFRRRGGWSPWVVTRLHARYTKESLGDDLVFRAAEPIMGGREVTDSAGVLETGGKKASSNNFQARYVIRHPWSGAITCQEPRRGVWGPPPPGSDAASTASTTPIPARHLAFVPRGNTNLASYVRSRIPELGLDGTIAGKEIDAPKANADVTPPPNNPKKDCGCGLVSHVDMDAETITTCTFIALAFVGRRRRKKMRSA